MQIGKGKQGVLIGEYGAPDGSVEEDKINKGDSNPILGYIEPACDNPQWILWFNRNGDATLYTKRVYSTSRGGPNNECTGAVEGDPIRISAQNPTVTKIIVREPGKRVLIQRILKDKI